MTYNADADLEVGETRYRHWPTGHSVVADGKTTDDNTVHASLHQPGHIYVTLWDANYVDQVRQFKMQGCARMLCTMDGIRIDENINALDTDDNPIEGLYVCGMDSGNYFSNTYPDLVPGACAGRSATFVRRAGRIAAQR